MELLRGNEGRTEHVSALVAAPDRVRRHEVRGLEDEIPIPLQSRAIGMLAVDDLREVDRMRLLPDEKDTDVRRRVEAIPRRHLRAPRTLIPLTTRSLPS